MTETDRTTNYESLRKVLAEAFERAARGKGYERHADPVLFIEQDIIREGRHFGIYPHLYQIRKKAKELLRLGGSAPENELLDIIVYAAAAIIILRMEARVER